MTQTFNTKRSEPRDPAHLVGSTTVKKIHINKEYANLVPHMTKEVFEPLMSSIHESGQHEPITVNDKGEVLDGYLITWQVLMTVRVVLPKITLANWDKS